MDDFHKQLLEKEYFHIQNVVEQFDSKSLTVKAWSVTLSAAIVGSSVFKGDLELLICAAIASLLFWLIDAYWKTFQFAYYKRIGQIEDYFSGKIDNISTPQIGTVWGEAYNEGGKKKLFEIMFWPHVLVPHGVMCFGFSFTYLYLYLC